MINITQGNNFSLKLTFTRNGEKFKFTTLTAVSLVSSVGRARALAFTANPDGSVVADAEADIPEDIYAVEVIGTEGGARRRTMFRKCVAVTCATERGDGAIAVDTDPYDIAMTVKLLATQTEEPDKPTAIQVGDFLLLQQPATGVTYHVFLHPENPGEPPVSVFQGSNLAAGLSRQQLADLPVAFADPEASQRCAAMYGLDDTRHLTYRHMLDTETADISCLKNSTIETFDEARFINPKLAREIFGTNTMNNNAFLRSVAIPKGVTAIGKEAFALCKSLQSVAIPETVTSIGISAFMLCKSLQSVAIPETVASIGNSAFSDCSALQSVTIPGTVASIGISAFSNCYALRAAIISEGVRYIGNFAFNNCYALQSVAIPETVAYIGENAFKNCSAIQYVTIPDGVKTIRENTFYSCSALKSVVIPASVVAINKGAFQSCYALRSVVIPSSVATVERDSFFKSFVIRLSLMGSSVCPSLGISTVKRIYVPADLVDAYKASADWSGFANAITAMPNQ